MALLLLSLAIILAVASCAPPEVEPPETCPPHADSDGNSVCDKCGEALEENKPEIPNLNFNWVKFNGATYEYNGTARKILVSGMPTDKNLSVEYEGNDVTDAGVYTVTARFYYTIDGNKYHIEGEDLTATLTITKATYDMSGVSVIDTKVYHDGGEHMPVILGTLPEGVELVVDKKSEVGKYDVTVGFKGSKNYNDIAPMSAKLEIIESVDGIRGLVITDLDTVFNGDIQLPKIDSSKLSDGVEFLGADYKDGNAPRNVGEYVVTLKFGKDGVHNPTLDCEASVKISKMILNVDAPSVSFDYDGEEHSMTLDLGAPIPSCVKVTEIGNLRKYPGVWQVEFRLVPDEAELQNFDGPAVIRTEMTIVHDETKYTEGLVFEIENGNYAVNGYTGSEKIVIVPSKYDGKSVTKIGFEAFKDTDVEFVYLPDSVTNISINAFLGAKELLEVRLGAFTKTIGAGAFKNSGIKNPVIPIYVAAIGYGAFEGTQPESIELPFIGGSHNTSNPFLGYIFGADGYGGNTAFVPSTLKRVVLNSACTEIAPYAFYGCESLAEVTIGENVKKIGLAAFVGTALKSIYIPNTVKEIPARAYNYNSPFYGLGEDFTIYLEADEAPNGFNVKWNVVSQKGSKDTPVYANVVYSASEVDQYN